MIETDVLVVGAGPAGLATAIALRRKSKAVRVLVLDKGRNPGSHVLSGAIVDDGDLGDLLTPEEIAKLPVEARVTRESFRAILSSGFSAKIPWVPPMMSSKGYPVGSLSKIAAYLAQIAEKEGAAVMTGYAVTELVEENGRVVGARTGAKGVDKAGRPKSNHLPPEEIRARAVVLAEGGAGILTDKLIAAKGLQGAKPQTYALAIKELVELPKPDGRGGEVMHTFGWPADLATYGGGFVYHVSDVQAMVGYAYALDYRNPADDPFELFRAFKGSKAVQDHVRGGKTVAYGAKLIPEGGYYAVPKPYAPGVLIVGDGAGLVDTLRIKGVHMAFASGVCAAEAILACGPGEDPGERYFERLKRTRGWRELKRVRNVRAGFQYGVPAGVAMAGFAWMTRGAFPWWRVGSAEEDRAALAELGAAAKRRAPWPEPVGPDRLTDVFLSGTRHDEDQPCHLRIADPAACAVCREKFGAPCTRFCPAEVYRTPETADGGMQADFSNCLHCKTCKIKCPYGNIEWLFPQGGEGPRYTRM
ncbi:MAG: electron transfer flavoprotein-ubiquinone oxidoreductase [Kiritimatiellae bacterium]|nr:electron transfer flavoprotein-ubiquinone oxidoreductase [Kiritimatiellia bacterium]